MDPDEQGDKSSAFPAFLETDPYPTTNDGRPTTSDSNATSEFDASKRYSNVSGLSGPVGEPGLPPSRPISNDYTQANVWSRGSARGSYSAQPTRRAYPSRADGGSRPTSPTGATHVPSLAAQGFFRPMSSQILQAQRGLGTGLAPGSRVQSPVPTEALAEEQEPVSEASYNATFRNTSPAMEGDQRRFPFNGTASPVRDLGASGEEHVVQNTTGDSSTTRYNSITPLNTSEMQDQRSFSAKEMTPIPKSPKSFRASLGLGSRHSSLRNIHDRKLSRSHERLHSTPQSPVAALNEKPVNHAIAGRTSVVKSKNYEYFAGNMLFFCSGRLINTKASPLNVVTFILTTLPAVLFFAFSAPWLWNNISPALPILFAYIFLIAVSSFLHAAFSDPGILPRNLHPHPPNPEEERDPLTIGPSTTEWIMVKTFPSPRQQIDQHASAENGQMQPGPTTAMEVPTKYCKSCNIWRPPRAHHCRTCDACVETQDHHCVWLNNCVGRRNYRFFFAYVGFSSIMAFMLMAFSLVHIAYYAKSAGISFGSAMSGRTEERVAFAMFIYSILALPYPGSLFVYHTFLVSRGETTREYLNSHKFLPKDRHRPFSQSSLLSNWLAVLLRPRTPSYMSFKRTYVDGDIRFGHTLRRKERKEHDKVEAARSESRVSGLKNRFSIPRSGTGRPGTETTQVQSNGDDMELKQLPTSPTKEGNDFNGGKLKSPGTKNSTPR